MNSLFYKLKQKVKYFTASNALDKRIAELNRYTQVVKQDETFFYVKDINMTFSKQKHAFLLGKRFQLFKQIHDRSIGYFFIEENSILKYKTKDLVIAIRNESDLYVLNEVLLDNCYRFIPQSHFPFVVMDIGMNVGIASLFFAANSQVEKVYSYELFKPTYEMALYNLGLNPDIKGKIIPHNIGLGSERKEQKLSYSKTDTGRNSLIRPAGKGTTETVRISPALEQLHGIISKHKNTAIYIKIDIEGAEYEVFDSLFAEELPLSVKGFILEWHFKGSDKLEKLLHEAGFTIISFNLTAASGMIYAFRI